GGGGGGAQQGSGGGTGGGSGGGAVQPYDGGLADLPCDVAGLVTSKCATGRRSPPLNGATMPLLSRGDFVAQSTVDATKNVAQRALFRMQSTATPMPPVGYPAASAAEVTSF